MNLSRRRFLETGSATLAASFLASSGIALSDAAKGLPKPTASKLPRWRGFNLLEKFNGSNRPFREDDFRNVSDLGFDFVRLPMDYRAWIVDGDKTKFNEKTLSEIDEAIEFGDKYGIHILINFHRAPGYTVANPPESPLVWNDKDALELCDLHWRTFAKRYASVPSERLSFNLFNEPAGCSEEEYFNVVQKLVEGIREESPERLIVCDGINWGGTPCPSLAKLGVAMATRGYAPMEISHYGASWVNSKDYPRPQWPFSSFNALLPVPAKKGLPKEVLRPLTIDGDFPRDATFRFRVGTVSNSSELVVSFDGKEAFRKRFVPKDGNGEWKEVVFSEKYGIYQNRYDLDVELPVPKGAKRISLANVDGDWTTITEIEISSNESSAFSIGTPDWNGRKANELRFERDGDRANIAGGTVRDKRWLWENGVAPWKELETKGVGVMVGEFGSHNVTPHSVALHWIEDMLSNWREAGWGWALWNFRGSFGVADSGRKDVAYEEWRGLQLDRKLVDLLQRY